VQIFDVRLRVHEPAAESVLSNNTNGLLRFNQFRTLLQHGQSGKRGFSAGATFGYANSGLPQYSVVLTSGYRRIALGSIRSENEYRFSDSLSNIGSFGNLLKKERLYLRASVASEP
jgi:hypothetical protein